MSQISLITPFFLVFNFSLMIPMLPSWSFLDQLFSINPSLAVEAHFHLYFIVGFSCPRFLSFVSFYLKWFSWNVQQICPDFQLPLWIHLSNILHKCISSGFHPGCRITFPCGLHCCMGMAVPNVFPLVFLISLNRFSWKDQQNFLKTLGFRYGLIYPRFHFSCNICMFKDQQKIFSRHSASAMG